MVTNKSKGTSVSLGGGNIIVRSVLNFVRRSVSGKGRMRFPNEKRKKAKKRIAKKKRRKRKANLFQYHNRQVESRQPITCE
jgi:hypothetical protein